MLDSSELFLSARAICLKVYVSLTPTPLDCNRQFLPIHIKVTHLTKLRNNQVFSCKVENKFSGIM